MAAQAVSLPFTPVKEIASRVANVRQVADSGRCRSLEWRRTNLLGLARMVKENEDAFCKAEYTDLHKPATETLMTELGMMQSDVALFLEKLEEWTRPVKVATPLVNAMDGAQIRREPLGMVLIIGAWNYPSQLTLVPLAGALAGGNAVVLKPSEVSPATAALITTLAPKYLDKEAVIVVNGAVDETTELLKQRFDHIMYTGNSAVAKIIYRAAAENLTPVTLELGGKSPCVVDTNVDVNVAARRIAWGRFINCGQTCVAPDYVLCEKSVQQPLVEAMKVALKDFFGEDPQKSPDYARVVNERHFRRVKGLIEGKGSGKIAIGGQMDEKDKYIAPTVLVDVERSSPVMADEIFGPVLPIVTVTGLDDAIKYINGHEKPLALYVFSNNKSVCEKVFHNTSSGGAIANDVLMHCAVDTLPFGGVGHSGLGHYHGKYSFDTFTHPKAMMVKDLSLEAVNNIRYPPYTATKLSWLRWLLFKDPTKPSSSRLIKLLMIGVVLAAAVAVAYPRLVR